MRPADRYQGFIVDLDGVLYRGDETVPGASESLAELRSAGKRVAFVTNNSWRTPDQVAEKLRGMGIAAQPAEVVTSGQATALILADDEEGRPLTAYVLGGQGVRTALAEAGIETVDGEPERVGYVVVGWDRDLTYDRLRTATVLVGRGATLVATNADASYPAPGGELWPGAGAILAAVEAGSGRRARVAGKPHRPLFDVATQRLGTTNALVVGDRIETDVEGAAGAGLDVALVLTGASRPADLLEHDAIPTMIVEDLGGLLQDRPDVALGPAGPADEGPVRALLDDVGLGAEEEVSWDPDATALVGRVEGAIGATAAVDVRGADGYLRSVAVREELRGSHLGTLVVAAAIRGACRRGAARASLVTETASGFFERLGFRAVDRASLPGWIQDRSRHCRESAEAMSRDVGQS